MDVEFWIQIGYVASDLWQLMFADARVSDDIFLTTLILYAIKDGFLYFIRPHSIFLQDGHPSPSINQPYSIR